ncbi:endolytic transglycosylase MltG [Geoalkalibacter halelectricus]|uniref:endolytic transglycosylase MltG n=1 Tax=Geoalkalibacter halelectricus TaxID=2847045 RepID=UPI003D18FEE7
MKKRLRILLGCFAAAVLLPILVIAADVAWFLTQPVQPPEPSLVTIAPGTGFIRIASDLEERRIIRRSSYFVALARYKEVQGRVHAGDYRFEHPARPAEVLRRLVEGDVVRYAFTVPEGLTLWDIGTRLEREGFGRAEVFLGLARDVELLSRLGIEGPSLEGYLFPETYLLERGDAERRLINAMVREFRRRALPEWRQAAADLGLDLHQWVTLASIVQAEAGSDAEMPVIAAVFHNRLRLGMRLQADPTVIYGVEDYQGRITRRHLRDPHAYNTYVIAGLPPGPIANPGAAALKATAFPSADDYLYFVSRGDGSHVFSRTLEEHNRAVRRYILTPRNSSP